MRGVDHLDLVLSDLGRSLTFYRGLLQPLGWKTEGEIEGERGERVVYLTRRDGRTAISLRQAQSPAAAGYDRYAIGLHHLCVFAKSRAQVDERARWAAANGATIESEPREYGYTPGYYAAFFHDPDGLKLEVLHRPRVRTLVWVLRGKPSVT